MSQRKADHSGGCPGPPRCNTETFLLLHPFAPIPSHHHYRIHPADRMAEWAAAMPEGFTFCPKFPQIITHFRRFNDCDGPTDDFIDGLLALGNKLGPAFIQLPPHFAPKHAAAMATYLEKWPRELRVAVEFRHPEWFEGSAQAEEMWARLRDLGMGSVISDPGVFRHTD